jgi:hypothetical protein
VTSVEQSAAMEAGTVKVRPSPSGRGVGTVVGARCPRRRGTVVDAGDVDADGLDPAWVEHPAVSTASPAAMIVAPDERTRGTYPRRERVVSAAAF